MSMTPEETASQYIWEVLKKIKQEIGLVGDGEALTEIPEGFSPGVLGEEATTTEEVLGKETASPTPEISPVPQGGLSRRNIIFAGIGVILLAAGYYFFIRRKRE